MQLTSRNHIGAALVTALLLLLGAAVTVVAAGSGPALADVQAAAGQYVPVTPVRTVNAASLAVGATYTLSPLGVGGVPASGVSAVQFQLSAKSTGAGWLEVFPAGVTRPSASQLNYQANTLITNSIVTPLGANGQVSIYSGGASAAVALYVDIVGYFQNTSGATAASTYVPLTPARIASSVAVTAGGTALIAPLGVGGIPAANVTAVVAHVTLTATVTGSATVYADGATRPGTTDLTYGTDPAYTNQVTAALGTTGKFRVYSTQAATVTVDVVGYYQRPAGTAAGSAYVGLTPARVINGVTVAAGSTTTYTLAGTGGVPATGASAVAFNLTANTATATGAISVWAAGVARPVARQLSYRVGGSWATLQVSKLSADGQVSIYNSGSAPVRLLGDVVGYYRAATVPGAPAGVTAVPDNGGANVSWTAAADGGAAITKYTVTASPGGASLVVTSGTSGRVTGLTNGTAYTFTVTATNAAGTSAASAASEPATPSLPAAPGQPFITGVTSRDNAVAVTWSPPPSGATTVTGYLIKALPGTASVQVDGALTAAVLTGLTNGTAYRLSVAAINANGTGVASEPSAAVVPATGRTPMSPYVTAVTALNQRVDVQWVAPPDGGADITGYTVTVNPGARVVTVPAGTTVASVTGLTNGTATTFAVAATNKIGTGEAATVTATPVAARVPAAPDDLRVSVPVSGQLTATWSPPADPGTSAVTGYTVTAAPGGATVSVAAGATSATLTGLTQTTAYTLTVRAVNAAGTGLAGPPSTALLPVVTVKAAPAVLSAASVATLRSVQQNGTLTFDQPPAQVSGLTAGSLIVMTANPKAPGGFFGRVTRAGIQAGAFVVNTVPAGMDEAFTSGGYSVDGRLTNADVASFTPLTPGARLVQPTIGGRTTKQGAAIATETPNVGIRDGALVVELDTTPQSDARGQSSWVELQSAIKPSYTNTLKVGLSGVSGSFTVNADTLSRVQGKFGYAVKFQHDWELGQIRGTCFDVQMGLVPVVICPEFLVDAKLEVRPGVGMAISVSYSRKFSAGITIADGVPSATGSSTLTGTPPAPQVSLFGDTYFEADIPVALSLFVYGAAGPAVVLQPYVNVFADTTQTPWWEVRAGLRVNAALKSERFFGKKLDFESPDLVNVFDTLMQAPGPFTGLKIVPVDPRTTVGGTVDLGVTVLGYPVDIPIQWSVTSGSGTIDSNGLFTSAVAGFAVVTATSPAASGRPALSTTTSVLVGPAAPEPPRTVKAVPGSFSASLTWTPPASNNGSAITGYVVTTSPPTGTVRVPATTTSAVVRGLAVGTDYLVHVYATNAVGASTPASPAGPVRALDDSFLPVSDTPTNATQGGTHIDGWPSLSRDGRYLIFTVTPGSTLAPVDLAGAANGNYLVRKDLRSGEIVLASRGPDGVTPIAVGYSSAAAIDGSGTVVAYGVAGTQTGVLVNNLATHQVVYTGATMLGSGPQQLKLSADGSTLAVSTIVQATAFESFVYRIRIATNTVTLASRCWSAYSCDIGAVDLGDLFISADGRYILFQEGRPTSSSFTAGNYLYDATAGAVIELHPGQQDAANTYVSVEAMSADASTTGGHYTILCCPGPESAFIQRSLTAPVSSSDLFFTSNSHPNATSVESFSDDGHVAVVSNIPSTTVVRQIWTDGTFRTLPSATAAWLSGDGRVVTFFRSDQSGYWVQRLS